MGAQEKVNILMVDDQPAKLLSYEVILSELGENLIRAGSGREALEHLLKTDVAVVLMDVSMPELDGFELAEIIRQHPRFQQTAIIFISAVHMTDVDRLRGYKHGAVDYISVPVVPEILRAKVSVFAELYRKTRQLEQLNRELEQRVAERTEELQKRAETLQRLNAQLAERNQELDTFTYITSHDLQEPLRMVTTYVQLFAKRYTGQLDTEAEQFIGFAVEGVRRMQALLRDLLAYTRVGGQQPVLARVDSARVLQLTLENLQFKIAEAGATITHDPLPTVLADASQLGLVFQNLVSNALKFCASASPRIHISAGQEQTHYRFAIRDNGIGVAPQYAEQIFQVFQRLHSYQEYPGTGMGLAICKKIIDQHSGRIWVEPAVGEGSTFFFTLPMA
jgi:signal transduction histidine kinase